MSNALLVQLLTQPQLQPLEASRTGSSSSNKYVLNLQANCTMMSKVQLEQAIDMNTNALQKDLHEQRMKSLRKLVKEIEEDDWRYEPVEKLIGLSFKFTVEGVGVKEKETAGGSAVAPSSPLQQLDNFYWYSLHSPL